MTSPFLKIYVMVNFDTKIIKKKIFEFTKNRILKKKKYFWKVFWLPMTNRKIIYSQV